LKTIKADIFKVSGWKNVVIPTNIGWNRGGLNVMGAGVAKVASAHFISLALDYGRYCRAMKSEAEVCFHRESTMILFPTKPLNQSKPQLSWQSFSHLDLVERSTRQLASLPAVEERLRGVSIYLPLVGCGLGGLPESKVLPILNELLDDQFTLCIKP